MNKDIMLEQLQHFFSAADAPALSNMLKNLEMENIIKKDGEKYTIITFNDPFLRIFSFLYCRREPITRSELRQLMKHKFLNDIVGELLKSRILYEYRIELSKCTYLIFNDRKEKTVQQISNNTITRLENSEKTYDKCHCAMIKNGQPILRNSDDECDKIRYTNATKNEIMVMVNLFNDVVIKKSRKIGRDEQFIAINVFKGDKKKTKSTLLSLIKKKYIRCSYHNFYYFNSQIVNEFMPIFEKNKKMLINNGNE